MKDVNTGFRRATKLWINANHKTVAFVTASGNPLQIHGYHETLTPLLDSVMNVRMLAEFIATIAGLRFSEEKRARQPWHLYVFKDKP